MFPEAFLLPQEQGGTTPPVAPSNSALPRRPADVSTIRRSPPLFNWKLARSRPQVDSGRRKVQTFLDSTTTRVASAELRGAANMVSFSTPTRSLGMLVTSAPSLITTIRSDTPITSSKSDETSRTPMPSCASLLTDHRVDRTARADVDPAGRLVENQQLRGHEDPAGEHDLLLHSARKRQDVIVQDSRRKAEIAEKLCNLRRAARRSPGGLAHDWAILAKTGPTRLARKPLFEVANHPFVDRCAFLLDSSFLEKARVAASRSLTGLETLTTEVAQVSSGSLGRKNSDNALELQRIRCKHRFVCPENLKCSGELPENPS